MFYIENQWGHDTLPGLTLSMFSLPIGVWHCKLCSDTGAVKKSKICLPNLWGNFVINLSPQLGL